MQAYKLKGIVDPSGQLVIHEPVALPPGNVDVIVWVSESENTQTRSRPSETTQAASSDKKPQTQVKAFEDLFENTQPAPLDFNLEEARWEALKEKYDL